MGHRTLPIRTWASAALGAAFLTTSLVTGIGAANAAASRMPFAVSVDAGSVGGSGKVVVVGSMTATTTFDNPSCVPVADTVSGLDASTAQVVIGSNTYTSPELQTWPATTPETSTSPQASYPCTSSSGQILQASTYTTTYTMQEWSVNYSCQAAGTAVSATQIVAGTSAGASGSPTTVPANGQLPASCFGSPAILLSPGSGVTGSQFGVSGSSYPEGAVSVRFDSTDVADLTVGIDGKFYTAVTVPAGASAGGHKITVSSPNTGTKTATFTVTAAAPAPKPALALSAATGSPGMSFTATGSDYTPGDTVTLEFDSVVLGTVKAGADGAFSLGLSVPADATAGDHTVTATVEGTGTQGGRFTVVAAQGPSSTPSASPSPSGTATGGGDNGGHCGCTGSGSTQTPTPGTTTPSATGAGATGGTRSATGTTVTSAGLGTNRGLAVQTAVAAGSSRTDRTALAGWSVVTGVLGLGLAAVAARQFRRPRRRA